MSRYYKSTDKAWGECTRSGQKMLLKNMVPDGYYPSLLVHPNWWEPKHPQEVLYPILDIQVIDRPSPERDNIVTEVTFPTFDISTGTTPAVLCMITSVGSVTITSVVPSLDFSEAVNSQYIPLLFH